MFDNFLKNMCFNSTHTDPLLYVKTYKSVVVVVVVDVDDVFLTENCTKGIVGTTNLVKEKFKICINEGATKFPGMLIGGIQNRIILHNKQSVWRVLCVLGLQDCTTVPTPQPAGFTTEFDAGDSLQEKKVPNSDGMLTVHLKNNSTGHRQCNGLPFPVYA